LKRFFGAIVVWCDLGGAAVAAFALRRAAFFEADFDSVLTCVDSVRTQS